MVSCEFDSFVNYDGNTTLSCNPMIFDNSTLQNHDDTCTFVEPPYGERSSDCLVLCEETTKDTTGIALLKEQPQPSKEEIVPSTTLHENNIQHTMDKQSPLPVSDFIPGSLSSTNIESGIKSPETSPTELVQTSTEGAETVQAEAVPAKRVMRGKVCLIEARFFRL